MSDKRFETIKSREAAAEHVRKTVANVTGLPQGLELDAAHGSALELGRRRWTFVLTKQAVENWDALGKKRFILAALVFHKEEVDQPYLERMLVALPGERGEAKLEMLDSQWRKLWSGRGKVVAGELRFSMPITRPRTTAKGMMAGRISSKGRLTLTKGKLPKPINKLKPLRKSLD